MASNRDRSGGGGDERSRGRGQGRDNRGQGRRRRGRRSGQQSPSEQRITGVAVLTSGGPSTGEQAASPSSTSHGKQRAHSPAQDRQTKQASASYAAAAGTAHKGLAAREHTSRRRDKAGATEPEGPASHADPIDEVTRRLEKLPLDPSVPDHAARGESSSRHDDQALLGPAYFPAEDTIRNDYSQYYVDTKGSHLPGSAVRNPSLNTRFEEYPKLQRLIQRKDDVLSQTSHSATYLCADLLASLVPSQPVHFHLNDLAPVKYDVVVIDPPLQAYERGGAANASGGTWSWEQIAALPIAQIVARESFVFLWVGPGSSDGLERGREVLQRWGFRRCEDIVWVQTNGDGSSGQARRPSTASASPFVGTTQHCLMGIRGTVRRNTDARFVHCNIDTDVILWEGEPVEDATQPSSETAVHVIDPRSKPVELMDIAENFCLGTRRLELFGRNRNLRRGWLTIGLDVGPGKRGWEQALAGTNTCAAKTRGDRAQPQEYDHLQYSSNFRVDPPGCPLPRRGNLVPYDQEIDELRPRSPPRRNAALGPPGTSTGIAYTGPMSPPMLPMSGLSPPFGFAQAPIPARPPSMFPGLPSPSPHNTFRPPPLQHDPFGYAPMSPGFNLPPIYGGMSPPFQLRPGMPPLAFGQPQYGYGAQPPPIHFPGLGRPSLPQPFAPPGFGVPMGQVVSMPGMGGPSAMAPPMTNAARASSHHGGAGLSGLGAGGPSVVSRQSGSELLSGAQASVLLGSGGMHSARQSPTERQQNLAQQQPQQQRSDSPQHLR